MKDKSQIQKKIIEYILTNHVTEYSPNTLPCDTSLLEIGVLDSYGVVELIGFIEDCWKITILDNEITREKMGSIQKMVELIHSKL